MLECKTYMLPGLTYEGSSSFQSIFQAEMERNIGLNNIADFVYIRKTTLRKYLCQYTCSKLCNICKMMP